MLQSCQQLQVQFPKDFGCSLRTETRNVRAQACAAGAETSFVVGITMPERENLPPDFVLQLKTLCSLKLQVKVPFVIFLSKQWYFQQR